MNLLDRLNAAVDGLCPCGGPPRENSIYCGSDCEPTHIAEDTDLNGPGGVSRHGVATPMRWRPDLVAAADDSGLIPLGSETCGYTGRFHAQIFEHADRDAWHLRLDDGHRYVGVDVDRVGGRDEPISVEVERQVREAWRRLERELTNPRRTEPADHTHSGSVAERYYWMNVDHRPSRQPLRVEAEIEATVGQWQRHCPACRHHGVPEDGMRVPPSQLRLRWTPGEIYPLDAMPEPERCQLCPHCRSPYPGPPLRAVAYRDSMRSGVVLTVAAAGTDRTAAQRIVPEVEVFGVDNPQPFIQREWDRLNEQVTARARFCAWLRANDIDPNLIPEDSPITTTRTSVAVDQYQPSAISPAALAVNEDGTLRRATRQVPLTEPWPEDLHHPNHIDLDLARENMRRSAEQAREAMVVLAEQLVPVADAFRLAFQGLVEGVEVALRPPAHQRHLHVNPARHPMLAAIEARRNRNTGPPADRLDGRRRRQMS